MVAGRQRAQRTRVVHVAGEAQHSERKKEKGVEQQVCDSEEKITVSRDVVEGQRPAPAGQDSTKERSEKPRALMMVERLRLLPAQTCPLALGINGLSRLLVTWKRVMQLDEFVMLVPHGLSALAAALLIAYGGKVYYAADAAWHDASQPGTLAALGAAPALAQALVVKLHDELLKLPLVVVQSIVLICHVLGISASVRFLWINFRRRLLPDPTWFPGLTMWGMTNITCQTVGPEWLRELMPTQFCFMVSIYVPLKLVVAYRITCSEDRLTITPNASMNTLMAPASFFAITHLSTGQPDGMIWAWMLMADSTFFLFLTVSLLVKRRHMWSQCFDLSYVSFTFPVASTALAAVLGAKHLPPAGSLFEQGAWVWASMLTVVAICVVLMVVLRYIVLLQRLLLFGEDEALRKRE